SADTQPTSQTHTLSLHDALPIYIDVTGMQSVERTEQELLEPEHVHVHLADDDGELRAHVRRDRTIRRELQQPLQRRRRLFPHGEGNESLPLELRMANLVDRLTGRIGSDQREEQPGFR